MEKRILVVDDEPSLREFLRQLLEAKGWEVSTAEGGKEALELFRERPTWIVLTDLRMPGMDGIELCGLLRRERPSACVVAMTAYFNVFDVVKCREAGFEDYFAKPLDTGELLASVEHMHRKVQRWRGRAEADA